MVTVKMLPSLYINKKQITSKISYKLDKVKNIIYTNNILILPNSP